MTGEQGIMPSKTLKSKVSGTSGPLDEKTLSRAERRVDILGTEFAQMADEQVKAMRGLLADITSHNDDMVNVKRDLKTLHFIAFELRGQSGSFGFPLVSQIATCLCRFIESVENIDKIDQDAQQICEAHVNAIADILKGARKGEGQEIDQKVLNGLNKVCEVYCQRHKIKLVS